ncbi:MAG: rod shape-determining protein RodA [Bacteroidetes bacterium]|nr:rod shape-determining protein RodA [Bacteroidota bacterium]
MRKEEKFTGNIDWITVLIYVVLVLIGWAAIYSAVYTEGLSPFNTVGRDTTVNTGKQFQWIIASAIFAAIILIIDGKFFVTFSYVIYGAFIPLLIGVMFFGAESHGQRNWIRIGGFQMQPSELVKFTTSLALAKYLSTLNVDIRRWRDKWIAFAIIGIPMLIVIVQGDAGSAIVFVVFALVLFREGLESYYLIIGGSVIFLSLLALIVPHLWYLWIAFAIVAALLIYFNFKNRRLVYAIAGIALIASVYVTGVNFIFDHLKPHQKDRINVLLGKEVEKGKDWNIRQSIIAIGSGGLTGKGYLQGTQTKLKFVPEQSTDFIYSSIGEEFGFAGSVLIIGLFIALLMRLMYLAERQRSKYSRVYGYCVVSILFFHFLINIGMAIGVAPVIGIPLPFISYGGSSLLAFTLLLFVFIRLDSQRLEVLR